ncbi:MAG: type II toxin-antitoxin system HipA family toxin [Pseudomonadota bacterium]
MTTSERSVHALYVYLQRPDNAEWVVVGRYSLGHDGVGKFRYAPSYIDSGAQWSIDPVNLPLVRDMQWIAPRYAGLHDILRDASPDAWGQALIRRQTGVGERAAPFQYLLHSGNADRWGALAIGPGKKPNIAGIAAPRIETLDDLIKELLAIANHQPTTNANIRRRLFATASMGGVRPKLTVRDGDTYWLAKPTIHTDVTDIARLEAATQRWGAEAGLNFAEAQYRVTGEGRGLVLVRRFDREGPQRYLTASGATLLQVQYPPATLADNTGASYPRLAEELRRIGAPVEDWKELFGRMVFNAVVGNDDDHCRNHAVLYRERDACWRLSPAFDVVPNTDETPKSLQLQLCRGRRDITRESLLTDHRRFGFQDIEQAREYMDGLIVRTLKAFDVICALLPADMVKVLAQRLQDNRELLLDGAPHQSS